MIGLQEFVGGSPWKTQLARSIEKAAPNSSTVLIQGESGTGKELVARALHLNSKRSRGPFVDINCAALPETLLESELFGHERGAFTSADRRQIGKFEVADGGTLFLDEIGELPLVAQTKLLRALQRKEFNRVGSSQLIRVDVRVIAATNRHLEKMVAAGTFRQDLFYRLNVLSIRTPALRERREDIPILANHFALKYGAEAGRVVLGISAEVLTLFQKHHWPGNVRELENVVQCAVLMGETETVELKDLPSDFVAVEGPLSGDAVRNFDEAIDEAARELCIHAFRVADGNMIKAARLLGLHRSSLYRIVRRLRIHHLLQRGNPLYRKT